MKLTNMVRLTNTHSMFRPGFHIIIRSLKRIADSLRQSASVSRLTCFHIVIRNRKESLQRSTSTNSPSHQDLNSIQFKISIHGRVSTIRLVSNERVITSKQ